MVLVGVRKGLDPIPRSRDAGSRVVGVPEVRLDHLLDEPLGLLLRVQVALVSHEGALGEGWGPLLEVVGKNRAVVVDVFDGHASHQLGPTRLP